MRRIALILGALYLGWTPKARALCSSPTASAGAMEFFTLTQEYKLCNGTEWEAIKLEPNPIGSCTVQNAIDYDSTHKSFKICDGTNYHRIEQATALGISPTVSAAGTANSKASQASWTALSNISVAAGRTLIVCVGSQDTINATGGVTWDGTAMNLDVDGGGTGAYGRVYSLYTASGGSGNIVVNFSSQSATGKALTATTVHKLRPTISFDVSGWDESTINFPSSGGSPPALSQSGELLFGCVLTRGPVEDTAGTWFNSFTNGQRTGSTGGLAISNITVSDGYYEASGVSYSAVKSGNTQRHWTAILATYRVLSLTSYGLCSTEGAREYVLNQGQRICDGSAYRQNVVNLPAPPVDCSGIYNQITCDSTPTCGWAAGVCLTLF